ncbi:MAG TPA: RNA polymerase sigma-70 factor [Flavipsychrobacter sp.]
MKEGIIFDARLTAYRMENSTSPIVLVNTDADAVFEQVFKSHFKRLHAYACTIVKDEDAAEEVVQNIFCKLWEKKEQLQSLQSVSAYLYRAVYNESLNYLKHEKVKANYQSFAVKSMSEADENAGKGRIIELEERVAQAMSELPEQCRTIFHMSRFEDMKYREIADKMGLSIKTVENQMGKALKLMRIKLADFLPILWVILLNM